MDRRGRPPVNGLPEARREAGGGPPPASEPVRPSRPAWRVLLAPLALRDFRLFWVGNVISLVGDQFQIIAIALLVLDLPQGAAGLGSVLMVQALPRLVLALLSGVAIDRFRARAVLLGSNLAQAAVVGALCLLAVSGRLTMAHVYLYAFASGTALAFSYPAASALIPELVPAAAVRTANSLSVSMLNLSRFLVPPVASWVIAVAGVAAAFGANGASFLVAAACVALIRSGRRPRGVPEGAAGRAPWYEELRDGVRAARRDVPTWIAIVVSGIYSLGYYGIAFVSLPALAKLTLGAGEAGVGVVYSALGAGALVGALVTGGLAGVRRPGLVGSLVVVGNGSALAAVSFAPSVWLAAPALFVSGVCGAASAVIFFSLVQTRAPESVRGRIMGVYSLAIVGMYPLSFGLAGVVNDLVGSRATILLGGVTVALAGLVGLWHREMRRLEARDP